MTYVYIGIVSILIVLSLMTKFQQRDEILKTSEKDNYQAVMDAFRQKGKLAPPLIRLNFFQL